MAVQSCCFPGQRCRLFTEFRAHFAVVWHLSGLRRLVAVL